MDPTFSSTGAPRNNKSNPIPAFHSPWSTAAQKSSCQSPAFRYGLESFDHLHIGRESCVSSLSGESPQTVNVHVRTLSRPPSSSSSSSFGTLVVRLASILLATKDTGNGAEVEAGVDRAFFDANSTTSAATSECPGEPDMEAVPISSKPCISRRLFRLTRVDTRKDGVSRMDLCGAQCCSIKGEGELSSPSLMTVRRSWCECA